jgi:hypothetical protein
MTKWKNGEWRRETGNKGARGKRQEKVREAGGGRKLNISKTP